MVSVEYAVIEKTDPTLASGQRKVSAAGVAGERTEVSRNLSKSEITKMPIDQAVSVGMYSAPAQNRTYSNSQPSQQQQAAPSNSSGVYYANCTAARAAGTAPVYRSDPGTGWL